MIGKYNSSPFVFGRQFSMLAFVLFQECRFQHLRFRNGGCRNNRKLIVGAVPDKCEDAYVGSLGRTWTEILPYSMLNALRVGRRTEVENIGTAVFPCEFQTTSDCINTGPYWERCDQRGLA